jgi:CubicO group peptidase (beta-lactamase class C family)
MSMCVSLVALATLISSCSGYEVGQPATLDDGWATAEASAVGLDEGLLGDLVDHVEATPARKVHGILIVRDGKLVFEEYFDGHRFDYDDPAFEGEAVSYDVDTMHNVMSVTKAITAALVGIAVDDDAIASIDESAIDALPAYADLRTPVNEQVTIEHLLTMTSGFEWNEWDVPLTDLDNDLIQLFVVDDPIAYILS